MFDRKNDLHCTIKGRFEKGLILSAYTAQINRGLNRAYGAKIVRNRDKIIDILHIIDCKGLDL